MFAFHSNVRAADQLPLLFTIHLTNLLDVIILINSPSLLLRVLNSENTMQRSANSDFFGLIFRSLEDNF